MKLLIDWIELKIKGCDELGGMEKEKATYQNVLKQVRAFTLKPEGIEPSNKAEDYINQWEAEKFFVKTLCTKFFYWWHNQSGQNTEQGFDKWWNGEGLPLFNKLQYPKPVDERNFEFEYILKRFNEYLCTPEGMPFENNIEVLKIWYHTVYLNKKPVELMQSIMDALAVAESPEDIKKINDKLESIIESYGRNE